jgi:predicted dehydrogenase
MIHDIDLVLSVVNSPIAEIRAAAVPVVSDTDDIANCRIQFANGCVANLTASRISARPMRKWRVFTQDRYASLDLKEKTAELYRLFHKKRSQAELGARYTPVVDAGNKQIARLRVTVQQKEMLAAELEDFITAVVKKTRPRVGLTEATAALSVALDIVHAAKKHRQDATDAVPVPTVTE